MKRVIQAALRKATLSACKQLTGRCQNKRILLVSRWVKYAAEATLASRYLAGAKCKTNNHKSYTPLHALHAFKYFPSCWTHPLSRITHPTLPPLLPPQRHKHSRLHTLYLPSPSPSLTPPKSLSIPPISTHPLTNNHQQPPTAAISLSSILYSSSLVTVIPPLSTISANSLNPMSKGDSGRA